MQISDILNDEAVGKSVTIKGWVYRWRESGRLVFIIIRDSTNIIQAIAEKGVISDEEFINAKKLTIESSLEITGDIVKEPKAVTGYEIHISSLKVYNFAEKFPEKSRTRRHLTEFSHLEGEAAWIGNQEMMNIEEELIIHIVQDLISRNKEDLVILKRDLQKLKNIDKPFYRYRYEKIIEIGRSKGIDLPDIVDLGEKEEREITEGFDKPIFVYNYPTSLKPFYHRLDPEDSSHVLCHDLLAPEGYGEVIGGGERIWSKEELISRIKSDGLNPDDYEWYIDLRKYGSVPHSGFGLGIDRLVTWLAGLDHIKNAVPFPRTIRRLKP